ncbi:MAG: hypothetical protein IRZ16_15950 [Myxococcaceae bacterium]|nr:hypothetical protein [Myxococcaceae bacterium]
MAACALPLAGCQDEPKAPPLNTLKPKPLPQVVMTPADVDAGSDIERREALFRVQQVPVYGDEVPKDAVRIELKGEAVTIAGQPFDPTKPDAAAAVRQRIPEGRPALIAPDADTFLAQAAPLFAALDVARVPTYLLHPSGRVAFRVTLSDEHDFQNWLDNPRPAAVGRIRIIHRADGYELQTSIGKLPGGDPNGPSVPRRGGQWDLARLRGALGALKGRFSTDEESCIVPSFGMELSAVATTLTGYYTADGERYFDALCLVYPRPVTKADAGSPAPKQ